MFTGIIEEKGTVHTIQKRGKTIKLSIKANEILQDMNLGDSIAVNGVCLTVTHFFQTFFEADVMPETYETTSLAYLNQGGFVNLERAMAANGRFGGHFVSGHVDCVGEIISKQQKENAIYITVSFPEKYQHLLLDRGSITLDGTSLTIFSMEANQLTVSLIPHTSEYTVLGDKSIGDYVNLEFDMIGKYLYTYLSKMRLDTPDKQAISMQFLMENGF